MKTVVGLFEDQDQARKALDDFARLGMRPDQIGLLSKAGYGGAKGPMSTLDLPDVGPVSANRPMLDLLDGSELQKSEGMLGALMRMGCSKSDALSYVAALKRGGTLEALTVSDEKEADVRAILQSRSIGLSKQAQGDVVIPLIEEELSVGKREIEAGGVRVSTHVTKRPVDQTVTLSEEHVRIERRVVDRAIEESDDAFGDQSFSMKATCEEPIVKKRAHVVEEIHIHKDKTERIETIRDTLRHTDVDISEIPAEASYGSSYREHFSKTYGSGGGEYESYAPAYDFGKRLRDRVSGDDWSKIEPKVKSMWAEKHPGAWERFRDAVRYAWESAKGR